MDLTPETTYFQPVNANSNRCLETTMSKLGIPYAPIVDTRIEYVEAEDLPHANVGRDVLIEVVRCPICETTCEIVRDLDAEQDPDAVVHHGYLEHLREEHPEEVTDA